MQRRGATANLNPWRTMSITKLKWQWQSSNSNPNDLANVTSQVRHQYGRVITGMLTGSTNDLLQPHHQTSRSSGGSDRGNNGY